MKGLRLGAVLLVAVLVAVVVVLMKHPTAAKEPGGFDPNIHRRQRVEYRETLAGRRYTNDDLKLSLIGPAGWAGALGSRPDFADLPYEGLVVKFEQPAAAAAGSPKPKALFSVVLRREGTEAAGSPREYAKKLLLGPGKTLVREPEAATLLDRPSCRIDYEMPSGAGALRIRQYVVLLDRGALVFSAMTDAASASGLEVEFDSIIHSLRIET